MRASGPRLEQVVLPEWPVYRFLTTRHHVRTMKFLILAIFAFLSGCATGLSWPQSDLAGHTSQENFALLWKRFESGTIPTGNNSDLNEAVDLALGARESKGSFRWGDRTGPAEVRFVEESTAVVGLAFSRSLGYSRDHFQQFHVLRRASGKWEYVRFYESHPLRENR